MFTHNLSVTKNELNEATKKLISDNLFPTEIEIVEALYNLTLEGYKSNRDNIWDSNKHWTKRNRDELTRLGRDKGFLTFPELINKSYTGEWLFDFVWIDAKTDKSKNNFDWRNTRGIKLACESEWSTSVDEILTDFFKLTFVRADIRLFIYTNRKKMDETQHPSYKCKQACPLSLGYRYLLIGVPDREKNDFRIDSWTA